jgi:1-acyl-sn-glycerol-3-phosphate acyltransferase
MLSRMISVFFITFVAVTSMILFVPAVIIWALTYLFDKRRVILHQYTCFWGALYTRIVPSWHVNIMNRKRFRKGVTYVVVSNHQSQLDILMAFNLFRHFKWVSKAEVFRVPFIGWNMYMNRYVYLLRGDKASIDQMMKAAEKRLREGSPVYFFPEGTRSPDGKVKKFKPGAFILAHKLKLPILPVAIYGTHKALPKYSMNFHGTHTLYLDVLDEIPYSAFSDLSVEETAEMVRKTIIDNVEKLTNIEEAENE